MKSGFAVRQEKPCCFFATAREIRCDRIDFSGFARRWKQKNFAPRLLCSTKYEVFGVTQNARQAPQPPPAVCFTVDDYPSMSPATYAVGPNGHHTASFHPDDPSTELPAIAGCISLRLSFELLFPQSLDNFPLTPGTNSVVRSTGRSNHCITRQTHPASWCAGGRSRTVPPAHSFKPANVRTHVAANPSRCHVTCFRLTSFLIRLGILPDWSVVRQIARQHRQTQHRHKH